MRKPSAIAWLGLIFGTTLTVEILTWIMGAPLEKSVARLIFITGLFAWLLKGSRFARYTLCVIYFLGGILAVISAIRPGEEPKFVILFWCFSIFAALAGGFFIRSNVLRALTSATPSNS